MKLLLLTVFTFFAVAKSQNCGRIFLDKTIQLTSENYPLPYPRGYKCFYLLKGENCTDYFRVEFQDFNVTLSKGCVIDRLEIGKQDALCGSKTGSKVYKSENGTLKLKFITDDDDIDESPRGFKLIITQINTCESDFTTTTELTTETATESTTIRRALYLPPAPKECCQNNFSSKEFLLISPNFPYSTTTPTDCIFVIKKSSPQVCRLRIKVRYFLLEQATNDICQDYLEIDGNRICGCKFQLKLITNFRDSDRKIFKFHSEGLKSKLAGFVFEIVQDECQKIHDYDVATSKRKENFQFYENQVNRIRWPTIDELKLFDQKSLYLPDSEKHFFFFGSDNDYLNREDKEETDYQDLSFIEKPTTDSNDYEKCITWNNNQIKEFGGDLKDKCIGTLPSAEVDLPQSSNCKILSSITGNMESPGYPQGYSPGTQICYRLNFLPGYCAFRMFFRDFHLEKSYDCLKDYLQIGENRYCGDYLTNRQVEIKLNEKIIFVSDATFCEKGFLAEYRQVQCQEETISDRPACRPSNPTLAQCNNLIESHNFYIQPIQNSNSCSFTIRKSGKNVCKMYFFLERFSLPCQLGYFIINNQYYCGEKSGQWIVLDLYQPITISYTFNINYYPNFLNRVLIRGQQSENGCFDQGYPDPARFVSQNPIRNIQH